MKKLIILITVFLLALPLMARAEDEDSNYDTFKSGDVSILMATPSSDYIEVGGDNRYLLDLFVPKSNRLLGAYVTPEALPRLIAKDETLSLRKYALVEVPRSGEDSDCSTQDFNDVIDAIKKIFADESTNVFQNAEDELNSRLKEIDSDDDTKFSLGKPLQLGCLFSKPNVYCFGMITEVSAGDKKTKMAIGCTLLRVNKRLVFVYNYQVYEDINTIKELRRTAENWCDDTIAANNN